jgi:hypothetical protein
LYNGQEIESPQKLALFEKQAIDWKNDAFLDTLRIRAPADAWAAVTALSFYRSVLKVARGEPELLSGNFQAVATSSADDLIAYRRGTVLVLVNSRPRAVSARVPGFPVRDALDLLSGQSQRGDSVALPAYGFAVLKGR